MRAKWKHFWKEFFSLAKDQFWPFILFWLAIFLMKFHPLSGLLSLAFINGEWAVRFWVEKGYLYPTAFLVCSACGNADLAMWFWFFKKGRFLLEVKYPKAGAWFARKFDIRQYKTAENEPGLRHVLKTTAMRLSNIFGRHPRLGLFLMGLTPFCGIVVGVPVAVGYKVKFGYFFMAIGNTCKIIIFGFLLANKITFLVLLLVLLVWSLLHRPKPPL